MSSKTQQIKAILVSLGAADKLPLDLNELDASIFEPVLAGAIFPGEMKDQYVSLEVPAPGKDEILANIRVKLDDEGVVVDAFRPQQDGDTGEHFQEPIASTWKTYQMMEDGDE